VAPVRPPQLRAAARGGRAAAARRRVHVDGAWADMPAIPRESVSARWSPGPALILDAGSTTLVPPGWRFRLDEAGAIVIHWKR